MATPEKSKEKAETKKQKLKENRFLVSINLVENAKPIYFVVNEDETIANIIENAMRCYTRQGRHPILPSQYTSFLLYSTSVQALNPCSRIGSIGSVYFMMYIKPTAYNLGVCAETNLKTSGKWRAWLNHSMRLKIPVFKRPSQSHVFVFGINIRRFCVLV